MQLNFVWIDDTIGVDALKNKGRCSYGKSRYIPLEIRVDAASALR